MIDFNISNLTIIQNKILNCSFKYNYYRYSERIPVFIINKDRLYSLKIILNRLFILKTEYSINIYILDHYTSYIHTINYYKYLINLNKITLIKLTSLNWKEMISTEVPLLIMKITKRLKSKYYIISDSDICLDYIPKDFINFYLFILDQCKGIDAIGPHITVSNLPNFYPLANHFFLEQTFYMKRSHYDIYWRGYFYSIVKVGFDTTFHVRRSNTLFKRFKGKMFRSLPPYSVLHTDWYINPKYPPKSFLYYANKSNKINHSYWK